MLKAFTNGCDTYIAESLEQAIADWEQLSGEKRDDYEDEWSEVSLDNIKRIHVEVLRSGYEFPVPANAKIEPSGDYSITAIATLREWAETNGRGFLCSTEY